MKATYLYPKHAFTCRNGVHTFSRAFLTFLRVKLALFRETFSDFQRKTRSLFSVSVNMANRHLIYVGNNLQLTSLVLGYWLRGEFW